MNRRTAIPVTLLALTAGAALSGCGNDVTPSRLAGAITASFDNLYAKQAALLGHPQLTPAAVDARAACKKGGTPATPPGGPTAPTAAAAPGTTVPKPGAGTIAQVGPGANWLCVLTWNDATGAPQTGKFEVNAKADSCFVAGGPTTVIGPATITDSHGNTVTNPVSEWDACFNPSSR